MKQMTMMVIIVIFSYLVVTLSSILAYAVSQAAQTKPLQGNLTTETKNNMQLSNQYIVTMKGNASESDIKHVIDFVKEKGGQVLQIYKHAIIGFSMSLPTVSANDTVAAIAANPNVVKVERDAEVKIASK
jgi:Peptidase inhibitor I9